jgi:hypothetical protein
LDGSFNHAATLGARATLHGTTTTGNVGFRCVKSPRRRVEHHGVYETELDSGSQLVLEDADGNRQFPQHKQPPQQIEDEDDEFDDEEEYDPTKPRPDEMRGKKKVVKPRTLTSDEL